MQQKTIATLELGRYTPTAPTLTRLCRALEVSADYLLGLTAVPGGVKGWEEFITCCGRLSEANMVWLMRFTATLVEEQEKHGGN